MQIGSSTGGQHVAAPVAASSPQATAAPTHDRDGDQDGSVTSTPPPAGSGRGKALNVNA
jgi:hypothetical protein